MMKCVKYENGKKSHLTKKRGVGNVTVTTNDKIRDRKNDGSSRSYREPTCSHSTPIVKKPSVNANVEESPDIDYSNLILLPCTQEGGNEVAWDWQNSLNRTPENRNNKQRNVQCETPKTTKLLQRKRNSNSPLLYKPLKRKSMKMENIENIGQFAAELQALNEKMRVIKQNDKDHSSDCTKEEEESLTNINIEEKTSEIKDNERSNVGESENDNKQNSVKETNDLNNVKKESSGNYDDLFDDSVDDDIIRCTQEMEEKINLLDKGNSMNLQVKKEESCTNDISNKISVPFGSSENCNKPLVRSILGASDNNTSKTYSKLSLRRNANSSIYIAAQKSTDTCKPCLNNNNIIESCIKKPRDNKKLSKSNTVEFDFPDDSFDDWLATSVKDEKLLPTESNGSLTHKNDSTKFQTNYKHLTNAPLKSEVKSANLFRSVVKSETSNVSLLENGRKFFKSKSLSSQYVTRDASINAKGTTNASRYAARGPIPCTSTARTSVSTKPIVMNVDRKVENNAVSLTNGRTGQTHGFVVDRCAVKSDGDRFVKHHSTGNMRNDTSEVTRTDSQPVRCTAEEIERKRLQAVARLEARKKLYFTKTNNINR